VIGKLLGGREQNGELNELFEAIQSAEVLLRDGQRIQGSEPRSGLAVLNRKILAQSPIWKPPPELSPVSE
jgi:hypothetical protein